MAKDRPKIVPAVPPPMAGPATAMPAAAAGSLINKVILFFISLLSVFIVYKLNEGFFDNRISAYWEAYGEQKDELGLEERKLQRWGGTYYYSKAITDYLKEQGKDKTALVLIAPTDYFREQGVDYYVPEPTIFYYMTGLKTLWPDCVKDCNPNWYVHAANGGIAIDTITSLQQRDSLFAAFNKYKIHL